MPNLELFDFQKGVNIDKWSVVDDGVMGGLSQGNFELKEGHGHFFGEVSLENNGGFSSVRYPLQLKDLKSYNYIVLRIKGDGKNYQVRLKAKPSDYESYIQEIETSGEWETIRVKLEDMYPSFRGRKLNQPNYDRSGMAEFRILIANKKNESFSLLIDKIELE